MDQQNKKILQIVVGLVVGALVVWGIYALAEKSKKSAATSSSSPNFTVGSVFFADVQPGWHAGLMPGDINGNTIQPVTGSLSKTQCQAKCENDKRCMGASYIDVPGSTSPKCYFTHYDSEKNPGGLFMETSVSPKLMSELPKGSSISGWFRSPEWLIATNKSLGL